MQDSLRKKMFEIKITSKGQLVIPKTLREKYNLKKGTRAKIIETKDGILIKSILEPPWNGLRGLMKTDWKDQDLNQLIKEAKKSLFKFEETSHG
jgi:AbrB family looped-hinge helix DNA binding protein